MSIASFVAQSRRNSPFSDQTRRAAGDEAAHAPLADAFWAATEAGGQIANARETRQGSTVPPQHQSDRPSRNPRYHDTVTGMDPSHVGAGLVVLVLRGKKQRLGLCAPPGFSR
jgi:hypothetical protein